MTFILGLLLLGLMAIVVVIWPLWRRDRKLEANLGAVAVLGLAIGLYLLIGRPDLALAPPAGQQQAQMQDVDDAIDQLARRLEANPDDSQGWVMLGRAYVVTGQYRQAANAFAEAQARVPGEDPDLLASFAEARALADPVGLEGEVGALFDRVLVIDPQNPRGLWYGGLAAQARGDAALAGERWRTLLEKDLPDAFRSVVENRLQALQPARADALLVVHISLSPELEAEQPPDGVLYVFIRPVNEPGLGPPVAARRVDQPNLPLQLPLVEADLLVGNALPDEALQVVARFSVDEDPQIGKGDIEGKTTWNSADGREIHIMLDRRYGD